MCHQAMRSVRCDEHGVEPSRDEPSPERTEHLARRGCPSAASHASLLGARGMLTCRSGCSCAHSVAAVALVESCGLADESAGCRSWWLGCPLSALSLPMRAWIQCQPCPCLRRLFSHAESRAAMPIVSAWAVAARSQRADGGFDPTTKAATTRPRDHRRAERIGGTSTNNQGNMNESSKTQHSRQGVGACSTAGGIERIAKIVLWLMIVAHSMD